MILSRETKEDSSGVRAVNEPAFGRPAEANLVDALRNNCAEPQSLVALGEIMIRGTAAFSRLI